MIYWHVKLSLLDHGGYEMAYPRISLEEFKNRVKEKHGNRFSVVDESFTRYKALVDIICEHGCMFTIFAKTIVEYDSHGCEQCKAEYKVRYTTLNKSRNFLKILAEIQTAHQGRPYTYEKAKDSFLHGLTYNLTITCNYHGDFTRHIFQQKIKGCPKCSKLFKNRDLLRYQTAAELVRDVRLIHGDYYDLSKIASTGRINDWDVPIVCPKHGEIRVKIITLLRGGGCETCVKQTTLIKGKRLLERMKSTPETRRKVSELICRIT